MIGSIGWTEMLLVTGAVIVFLGGGNRLPEIARSIGEAIREFKRASNSNRDEESDTDTQDQTSP
jgi:sec-independent protein translocase protein TatA